jgi:hypothetical protein
LKTAIELLVFLADGLMGSSAEMAAYAAGSSGTAAKGWTVDVIGCTRELLEEGAMGHKAVGQNSWVEALLPDGIGRQSVPAADRRPSRLAALTWYLNRSRPTKTGRPAYPPLVLFKAPLM